MARPHPHAGPLPAPSLAFFTLPDGQLSPLDRIMLSARSLASPSPNSASSPYGYGSALLSGSTTSARMGGGPFLSPLATSVYSPSPSPFTFPSGPTSASASRSIHTPLWTDPQPQPPSPHSPLLHTRFGTPHSPASSVYSHLSSPPYSPEPPRSPEPGHSPGLEPGAGVDADAETGMRSREEWSPRSTGTSGELSRGGMQHLLEAFEEVAGGVPGSEGAGGFVGAAGDGQREGEGEGQEVGAKGPEEQERVLIGPVPRRKQSKSGSTSATPSASGTNVLPGWEGSYFPPMERYRAPRSPGRRPTLSPPAQDSTFMPSSASPERTPAAEGAYDAPPTVIINSPDLELDLQPAPQPTLASASASGSTAVFEFVVTDEPAPTPPAERPTGGGRARSYTSGNFSRPRIAVSPVLQDEVPFGWQQREPPGPSHWSPQQHSPVPHWPPTQPQHQADRPRTSGQVRTPPSAYTLHADPRDLRRSNSQPSVSPTHSLHLQTAFPQSTTPPELSLSANSSGSGADTSFGFPRTPARSPAPVHASSLPPSGERVNKQLSALQSQGKGGTRSPAVSVYSDYSYYSVDSSSSAESRGVGVKSDELQRAVSVEGSEPAPPAPVRADSLSGRYVKALSRHGSTSGVSTAPSTTTVGSAGTATAKPPRPPPPAVPITRPHPPTGHLPAPGPGQAAAPAPPSAFIPPRPSFDSNLRRTPSLSSLSLSSISEAHRPAPAHPEPPRLSQPLQHLYAGLAASSAPHPDLFLAAEHFEKSAKLGGGCPGGMILWGLTLRRGWGMRMDDQRGLVWLRKGVERALKEWEGEDQQGRKGLAMGMGMGMGVGMGDEWGGMRQELVRALGEVARGFMYGRGVKEDKKLGFGCGVQNYFLVAANLGDPACAQEVAQCYEKGRGVRKDKTEAARWYRRAVGAGGGGPGLDWIWKGKYD
ncbi:hypothetical protein CALVIDRAFT_525308 [Calocera viscosa TUFC12733]|uniref:HCP-like protein n=1 Tax=Calocera viscosa (strain TUFC12733) TaxID=1330018 RepID=A0A167QI15_CALVF|nr:hypothetical protein CALVIDRAFT_525308 [Calocera viscosa TUFC12733]